ncbi:MAG: hypothetical protein IPH37_05655 [Burkholderiales bacterium]|nr:hypothetical protein [Burkholderiales bacterium]
MPLVIPQSLVPEMLDELQKQWSKSLSWKTVGYLWRMTAARTKLKLEKGLGGPMMHCRHCNAVHEMRLAPITIRSLLFALRKQGILTDIELKQLDLAWRRYQAKQRLDGCGKKRVIGATSSPVPNHGPE